MKLSLDLVKIIKITLIKISDFGRFHSHQGQNNFKNLFRESLVGLACKYYYKET
jgi:hypothetical protein